MCVVAIFEARFLAPPLTCLVSLQSGVSKPTEDATLQITDETAEAESMEVERREENVTAAATQDQNVADAKESDTKPPIDLFKSIFLDDSDESDDEANKSESEEKVKSAPEEDRPADDEKSDPERIQFRKPAFTGKGLFANIDFDRLNRKGSINNTPRQPSTEPVTAKPVSQPGPAKNVREENKLAVSSSGKEEEAEESYGPAKPAGLVIPSGKVFESESDSSSDGVWTEKKSDKKKKRKKEKKKKEKKKTKKSDKHKRDKKKKKKKKKRETDESSTQSDDSD
jgi:hypothetical protein